jgi:hypothetical protein
VGGADPTRRDRRRPCALNSSTGRLGSRLDKRQLLHAFTSNASLGRFCRQRRFKPLDGFADRLVLPELVSLTAFLAEIEIAKFEFRKLEFAAAGVF